MAFPPFAVIITAAGQSQRFNSKNPGDSVKKEYLKIDGHTVLYRSVAPFLAVPNLQAIIVTSPKDYKKETLVALEELSECCPVPLVISEGGQTRQESVFKALELLKSLNLNIEFAAIHDGARCFIKPELIIRTLATAKVYGACAPALAITDATKEIDKNGIITNHVDRREFVTVQTPQIFRFPEILFAHQNSQKNKTYFDDTEIYSDFNLTVGICEGDIANKKITYLSDIPDADKQIEKYLETRNEGLRKGKIDQEFRSYINTFKPDEENE